MTKRVQHELAKCVNCREEFVPTSKKQSYCVKPDCQHARKINYQRNYVTAHRDSLFKVSDYLLKTNDGLICRKCNAGGFKSEQALISHVYRVHTAEGNAHRSSPPKGIRTWNKGLTKSDPRVAKSAATLSTTIRGLIATGNRVASQMGKSSREKLSKAQSVHNHGGRSKWYEVSGQKVQGTWERDIAIKFDQLGIRWEKLKTGKDILRYTMNDKEHSYTPDFYLADFDVYLEIKGYWWGNDKAKMDAVKLQHPEKRIIIVQKDGYKKILDGERVW